MKPTVHKHTKLLQLPEEHTWLFSDFLPKCEDSLTQLDHNSESRDTIIKKIAHLSQWKWGHALLFHQSFKEFMNLRHAAQSDCNDETHLEGRWKSNLFNHSPPPSHSWAVLDNTTSLSRIQSLLIFTFGVPLSSNENLLRRPSMYVCCLTILSDPPCDLIKGEKKVCVGVGTWEINWTDNAS